MNNDIYAEWLVKRKKPAYLPLVYVGFVLAIFVGIVASMLNPFGFIVLVLAGGGAYYINMRLQVEYEYVFVTNEMTVDRICGQRVRKKVATIEMQKVEKIISTKSHEYDFAKNNPKLKLVDYSSQKADANVYAIVYAGNEGQTVYLFEPNDKLLKCLKNYAPSKVKIDPALSLK